MHFTGDCGTDLQHEDNVCHMCCSAYQCSKWKRDLRTEHFSLHSSICRTCYMRINENRMSGGGAFKSAFGGALIQHTLPTASDVIDPMVYLQDQKENIKDTLIASIVKERQV